jgi:hypothetical protein
MRSSPSWICGISVMRAMRLSTGCAMEGSGNPECDFSFPLLVFSFSLVLIRLSFFQYFMQPYCTALTWLLLNYGKLS